MRHLYGIALAVAMTLVMFFGGAWGYLQLLKLPVPPGQTSALPAGGGSLLSNSTALLALGVLVVIAVLAGLLAVIPRISPLASGLPGAVLLAWTALFLVSVRHAVEIIPLRSHAFGAGWEGLLFNGVLGAVGAVMVFPLFIPSRWHGPHRTDDDVLTRDVADYLTDVKADARPTPQRDQGDRFDEELVGTVLTRAAGSRTVDTSRVTGASRALRNTGSFTLNPGAHPRSTGSMPRATGSIPRATDSSPRPAQGRRGRHSSNSSSTLLGRPYEEK